MIRTDTLTIWIRRGLLVLVALVPFHAFLTISLGHWLGHQDLIAAWKEVLLAILALLSLILIWRSDSARARLKSPVIVGIGIYAFIALGATVVTEPPVTRAIFGLKTEFEFLFAAVIALLVGNRELVRQAMWVLLAAAGLVAGFAVIQATLLPHDVLTHLGYTFAIGQPAPYEMVLVGDTTQYRFASTLGGPNQLGTFLILPLVASLLFGLKRRRWWIYTILMVAALFVTYSRGAWVGAAAAGFIALVVVARGQTRTWVIGTGVVAAILVGILAVAVPNNPVGDLLRHPAATEEAQNSDDQHVASLQDGSQAVLAHPLGSGLGSAGPATFHAGTPNIIENYYLQIAFETGILGLIMFVIIIARSAAGLIKLPSLTSVAVATSLLGISVTALVLPAWTDSTTALSVWTLAGLSLGARHD